MTTNTKTVAFVNLKGGVGKTTSAIGTAEALARLGHTVTVRDADPSGAATLWAHKALSAGRPLPFGVEVVNRFTVAAPAEEEWVLIDTPPLQTDLVEAAVDAYESWQRKMGRDINPTELVYRVRAAGAKRVKLTAPADIVIEKTQLPKRNTRTVTYGGLEDD